MLHNYETKEQKHLMTPSNSLSATDFFFYNYNVKEYGKATICTSKIIDS